jgi:hypothetical protein
MTGPSRRGFFGARWHGEVPMGTLLWRDLFGVGTLLNVAASVAALILAAQGVPTAVAAALHFAPVPYNAFLLAAVQRSPQRTAAASGLAVAWFVASLVV